MIGRSVFDWRTGEPSVFALDAKFAARSQGGTGVAPQPMPGTRFPGKSINTESVKPQDKTAKIRRGAM